VQQLQANDQAGTVTQLQGRVAELTTQVQQVENYFSTLLEAEYANLPEASVAMVKDIPGGARQRFEYLTKHRARLTGAAPAAEAPKGKEGPSNDPKPKPGEQSGASASAKGYTERQKTSTGAGKTSGWGSLL